MNFTIIEAGQSKEMPAKVTLYGVPKIGKTTLAAEWPDALFINIEGGLDYLTKKVKATPKLKDFAEVTGWLKHIYTSEKPMCKTIVIDSLDWCENLAQAELIKEHGAKSITDPDVKAFAYHKGVADAASNTMKVFAWLDAIHVKHDINAVIIAHTQIRDVDLPGRDPFQRYEMKLSKQLAAKCYEWSDLVLFADYEFVVSKDGKPSEPQRVLLTGGSASYLGGGRMSINKKLPLNYEAIRKEICK